MFCIILCVATAATAAVAAPALYDQRQDGELNVQADVKNVVLVIALPQKMPVNVGLADLGLLLGGVTKESNPKIQERSDINVMEAFVESPSPYRVEIGESTRELGDEAAVVIAGRGSAANSVEAEGDELKLLGATEQCGPGRERDPDTLTCREKASAAAFISPVELASPAKLATPIEPVPAEPAAALTVLAPENTESVVQSAAKLAKDQRNDRLNKKIYDIIINEPFH